jgi:hypothetical protein
VVGEPTPEIEVSSFEWDDDNEEHLYQERHGWVTIADVTDVHLNAPRYFRNLPDRGGTHVLIGPSFEGRFFYIVLAPTKEEGRWRPITGWKLTAKKGRQLYNIKRRD